MKTLSGPIVAFFIALLSPWMLQGQSVAQLTPIVAETPPPLGLLRLTNSAKPGKAAPLAIGKFSIDDLAPANAAGGGAIKATKNSINYIALDAGKQWSQALRGSPKDPTYASFMVYGSQTTIIEVGGARLGVTAGPIAGSLQLMFDDATSGTPEWKSFNVHLSIAKYDGKEMAALPVLTVQLDPSAGIWSDVTSPNRAA